jgi:hypothetical protein
VRCDVTDVLHRLRAGDTAGAVERYGGELLPGSESPALAEFGTFVTVALRNALLADSHPAAVQRYLELTPHDVDLLDSTAGRRPANGQLARSTMRPADTRARSSQHYDLGLLDRTRGR